MGKKKIAGTKNVYELAQERLKVIFNEFDNIYVSFSGGKDSGVLCPCQAAAECPQQTPGND